MKNMKSNRSCWLIGTLLVALLPQKVEAIDVNSVTTTFSGTLVLGAATSTPLTAASSPTMSPNSATLPLPGFFQRLVIIPPASCAVTVNWFGGTATATSGEPIGSGTNVGTDTVNLSGLPNAPTLFSTVGCTVFFRN